MALQLEEDAKDEQVDDHRLRIGVSPSHERFGLRNEEDPTSCPILYGPRTCATLPPTLNKHGQGSSEPKKRRLWGLRSLVKMFRRRTRRKGLDSSESHNSPISSLRTRSASELAVDQSVNRSSGGPYNQGLSVSHDSVFSPESPTEEQHSSTSNLALVTRGVNMAELKAALRRRRTHDSGSPDYDPGLPRSPPTSPNSLDVLCHGFKSSFRATQSSCSDASLLSMGSSEYDEDSFGSLSLHSSRVSLMEGPNYSIDNEPAAGTVTLSHHAARHKMAVRPRRTHASSKMRKQTPLPSSSLPTTIEVNEESMHRNSESMIQQMHVTARNSKENLASTGEFHAREAVEALVVELVTEKSKSYFSRSFEEKRSSHISAINSSRNFVSSHDSIDVGEMSAIKSNINKERNKSDPTSFSKRISIGDSYLSSVCSQRASSLEGLLSETKSTEKYFVSRVINNESQFQLRGNHSSSVDIVSPPVINPETPKTILSAGMNIEPDISISGEQSCKIVLPNPILSDEQTKKLLGSLSSRESRSSIDNLTTTLLPGIYIRPFSPSPTTDSTLIEKTAGDSSNQMESKSTGVSDFLIDFTDAERVKNDIPNNEKHSVDLQLNQNPENDENINTNEGKKVIRESSFTSHTENKPGRMPEFMRVHLNRVKSFNSPVILNTTVGQSAQTSADKDSSATCVTSKIIDGCHPVSPMKPPRKDKPQELVLDLKSSSKESVSVQTKEETPIALPNETIAKIETSPKEEIVLRRPSLLDKSVVLDQNVSTDGSKKSRSDQPELLKVFARRSFKLKETEADDKVPEASLKMEDTPASISTEIKKEENKPQMNAMKRYSIGSCPLPFVSRFADTNATQTKIVPIDTNKQISNMSPSTTKSQTVSTEISSKSSQSPKSDAIVQSPVNVPSPDVELPSKLAYSRRSFSHVALKSVQPKSSLGRTSSANQSDYSCKTTIINRSNACIANNVENNISVCEETKLTRPAVETKPTITTKPVVWPPVKPLSETAPKTDSVDIITKPQPIISRTPDTSKVSANNTKVIDAIDSESKENNMPLYRFHSEAPRKPSLAEARNTSFAQSLIIENAKKDSLISKTECESKPAGIDEPAGDWRVLVRRRREDRLKQTKSMDADELIMETRPNANRSSKVLEMANNFQKLQVA